jgi:hypothetical protein
MKQLVNYKSQIKIIHELKLLPSLRVFLCSEAE